MLIGLGRAFDMQPSVEVVRGEVRGLCRSMRIHGRDFECVSGRLERRYAWAQGTSKDTASRAQANASYLGNFAVVVVVFA
jgi:hypothetical protein